MPLRNRVTPEGAIVATPARGEMYGNRGGCFHRADQTLKARQWANRQWICCVLEFKNRRRTLMQPDRFTELFFLDEATAFAAGHRPCFECRRADAVRFQALWSETKPAAPAMDIMLHTQRLTTDGQKRAVAWPANDVPDGAMIRGSSGPHLVLGQHQFAWQLQGYGPPQPRPVNGTVVLLTPPAITAILRAGYRPMLHSSLSAFAS
jgi:hypothetical protein